MGETPLLLRIRRGEPAAFHEFVRTHEGAVFALLSRMVGHGPEVEDLAQETFLRAFRALPTFDPHGPATVSTWLLTIATRLAIDARRKSRPLAENERVEEVDPRTPESEGMRLELGERITRAAEGLPDDQRAAFVLSEFHGFSTREVSEALEIPENTAKTRLFRAREALRHALSDLAPKKEDRS